MRGSQRDGFSLLSTDGDGIYWSPELRMCSFNAALTFAARKDSASKNLNREHGWPGRYLHDTLLLSRTFLTLSHGGPAAALTFVKGRKARD